jgi:hypothetical protein
MCLQHPAAAAAGLHWMSLCNRLPAAAAAAAALLAALAAAAAAGMWPVFQQLVSWPCTWPEWLPGRSHKRQGRAHRCLQQQQQHAWQVEGQCVADMCVLTGLLVC